MNTSILVTRIRRGLYAISVPGQRPLLVEGTRREAYARAGQLRKQYHTDRVPLQCTSAIA